MVEGFRLAHHHEAVAVLQSQVVGGEKFHVAARHSAHVHAVGVSELQLSEAFTVQNTARKHQNAALHLRIHVVPVDALAVPVGFHLFAEEHFERLHVVFGCHDEDVVMKFQVRIGLWHKHLFVSPKSGNHKAQVRERRHLGHGFVVQRGVHHYELCNESLVFVVVAQFKVFRLHEEAPHQHHHHDDAEHTKRIGHRRGQSRRARR